jgi:hypothetical protein
MNVVRSQPKAAVVVSFIGLGLFLSVSNVLGTLIEYGDFTGSTVWFEDVREDSGTDPTPLYGTPSVAGDSLDFDPVSFQSHSKGVAGVDVTDGALGLAIQAKPGLHIPYVDFAERGDYTLVGFNGDAMATVSALFVVNIVEIDGTSVNVIALNRSMTFTPQGQYLLSNGVGPIQQGVWEGQLRIDLDGALADRSISGHVTRVTIVADNTLTTATLTAENEAVIQKKDFSGLAIGVPEPATLSVLLVGTIVCSFARRIRRSA